LLVPVIEEAGNLLYPTTGSIHATHFSWLYGGNIADIPPTPFSLIALIFEYYSQWGNQLRLNFKLGAGPTILFSSFSASVIRGTA
jgi:hypothetical protein